MTPPQQPPPPQDSMSLRLDELDRKANIETILRIAKSEQLRRKRSGTTSGSLYKDVVRQLRHWRPDIPEEQIRKVMRDASLLSGDDDADDADGGDGREGSSSSGRGGGSSSSSAGSGEGPGGIGDGNGGADGRRQ